MSNGVPVKFGSRFIIGSVNNQNGSPASAKNKINATSALCWNLNSDANGPGLAKFQPEISRVQDAFIKGDTDYQPNTEVRTLSKIVGDNRIDVLLTGKDVESFKKQTEENQKRFATDDDDSVSNFNPETGEFENPALDKANEQLQEAIFTEAINAKDTRLVNIVVKPNTVEASRTTDPYDSIEIDSVSFKTK